MTYRATLLCPPCLFLRFATEAVEGSPPKVEDWRGAEEDHGDGQGVEAHSPLLTCVVPYRSANPSREDSLDIKAPSLFTVTSTSTENLLLSAESYAKKLFQQVGLDDHGASAHGLLMIPTASGVWSLTPQVADSA